MRLTDIMSHMDLHVYTQIGLVIFLIAFIAVVVRVLLTKREDSHRLAMAPLDDGTTTERGNHEPGTTDPVGKETDHGA